MELLRSLVRRLGVVRSLFAFVWRERLWWLIPILLALVAAAALIAVATNPATAPFVYTLF